MQKLDNNQKRVLCISCCHSKEAAAKMTRSLSDYFTAIYCFREEDVTFAKPMTVWSMFHHEKNLRNPEGAIVERINKFFNDDVLDFKLTASGRARRDRNKRRT